MLYHISWEDVLSASVSLTYLSGRETLSCQGGVKFAAENKMKTCPLKDLDLQTVTNSSACNYKKGLGYPKKGLKKDSIFG